MTARKDELLSDWLWAFLRGGFDSLPDTCINQEKHMYFIWLDLETSGLDPKTREILSIGVRVTDTELNTLGEVEVDIRHTDAEVLLYDPAALDMHRSSGLIHRCERSPYTFQDALVLAKHLILTKAPGKTTDRVLAGSSVHFDVSFLRQHAPDFLRLFHYRQLDVSVFKVLSDAGWAEKWPGSAATPKHTPLADLDASIAALSWYRERYLSGTYDHGAVVAGKTREEWAKEIGAAVDEDARSGAV